MANQLPTQSRILASIQALGPAFEMAGELRRDEQLARLADAHPDATDRELVDQLNQATIGAELAPDGRRAYILAGRAIVTLAGQSTRYTYRITRKDPDPGSTYTQPAYFVSLLTGPDNVNDYTYVGMLDVTSGTIRLTRKSSYRNDSAPVRAWNWTIGRVWRNVDISPAQIYHVGRCGRCGRALTVPSSITTGLGPECAARLGE